MQQQMQEQQQQQQQQEQEQQQEELLEEQDGEQLQLLLGASEGRISTSAREGANPLAPR